MNEPSVKDVLDYEALPDEVKRIAEAFWLNKIEVKESEIRDAYDEGYKDGERDAECDCEPDADLQDEVDELRTEVAVLKSRIAELADEVDEAATDGYERGYGDGQEVYGNP